jgi:hypothetical protein
LKQGDTVSLLLFNFAVEYTIMRVQVNQGGLKLNGTYQVLVYADYVNILWESVQTVKKNAENLVVASKKIRLEANVDRTKYMVTSRDQNVGRSLSIKNDNSSFERVKIFGNKLNKSKFYSGRN